jgi:hypothetical protein
MTPEQLQAFQLFHPYAWRKIGPIIEGAHQRFVHYTSADAAMSMLKNKEVWMRKASMMNDFREIEYGLDTLAAAYRKEPKPLKAAINRIYSGLSDEVEKLFDVWQHSFRDDTFITCMSEHDDSEDILGRLSMWRAYGSSASVAFVLNPQVFISDSDVLGAATSPVAYVAQNDMEDYIIEIAQNITDNEIFLRNIGREAVHNHLFNALHLAAISSKHPGFHEEREWRIVYNPRLQASDRMKREIVSIRGIPQIIYKIPLQDDPASGLIGAEVPKLIERVIIGPSKHPYELRETFVEILKEAGMPDPSGRVWMSEIPLRI